MVEIVQRPGVEMNDQIVQIAEKVIKRPRRIPYGARHLAGRQGGKAVFLNDPPRRTQGQFAKLFTAVIGPSPHCRLSQKI